MTNVIKCDHQSIEPKPEPVLEEGNGIADMFTKVIEFAIETDCSKEFLRCWLEGDFESIKNEWPDFKGYVGE